MSERAFETIEHYKLVPLSKEHIRMLFDWNINEKHFEQYTCRPVKLSQSLDEYGSKMLKSISEGKDKNYVLIKKGENKPLGKIRLFDFNPRNHSAEFGYYLPRCNRHKGLGAIMLLKFIETIFLDDTLNINKMYATTASNNNSSIKLLEKFGFKLDGSLREHYWIDGIRYDQLNYSMLRSEWDTLFTKNSGAWHR